MALKDLMPWGRRRAQESGAGALENVRSLVETMERAFEEPWDVTTSRLLGREWLPQAEVKETEKAVLVTLTLPDMKKEELHVCATESTLSIRGMQKTAMEEKRKHGGSLQQTSRSFYRSFTLPASVRPDDVKASYKDGMLKIELPKTKHSQVRRVTID